MSPLNPLTNFTQSSECFFFKCLNQMALVLVIYFYSCYIKCRQRTVTNYFISLKCISSRKNKIYYNALQISLWFAKIISKIFEFIVWNHWNLYSFLSYFKQYNIIHIFNDIRLLKGSDQNGQSKNSNCKAM
jgi:hypothetical protein